MPHRNEEPDPDQAAFECLFPARCDTPLSELLTADDDFDVCHGVTLKIMSHYGDDLRLPELSREERAVLLVMNSKGYIDNGGFVHFLEMKAPGDPTLTMTLEAYDTTGNADAADTIRRVIATIPVSVEPPDWGSYFFEHTPRETWESMDQAFFTVDQEPGDSAFRSGIEHRLARYIRENQEAYRHLDETSEK